ncbi:MAG: hypothetical protein HDR88_06755 [Bacteroides sp.]|nr:hypothetical protein [Bacteroides sp.]
MDKTKLIIQCISLLLMSIFTCCIHTYPDGEGVDPTLVQIGVEVSIDASWETLAINFSKAEDRINNFDYRLIIEFTRNGKQIGRCEHFLTQEEYAAGHIKLIMPFDFHAVTYNVTAWLDCVEAANHKNSTYYTDDFYEIVRNDHHVIWSDDKMCVYGQTDIDLHAYKDKWGAKVKVPLTLSPPIGRFKIIASDMEGFQDYIKTLKNQEETYSVCIAVDSHIPKEFNAIDNKVIFYQDPAEYYFPMPESGSEIASGEFFVDETGTQISAKIIIYNSARLIVSKSPTITIPLERGKVTAITGSLLTDFYTNSINVNTVWDGEIIIEI